MVAPLVMQSRLGKPIAVVVIEAALSFVSVAVLASAWKELDSNAEVEELNDLDDDEPVLTPRNHGYGEPRSLPLDGLPDLLGTRDPVKLGRIRVNEPSCGGLAP